MESINEVWKPIRGFEGLYEISNKGRIKRVDRHIKDARGVIQHFPESILSPSKNKYGYLQTTLRKDTIKYTVRVHKLVAIAFVDNPQNKPIIDHIDGNKTNNNSYNLRWVTNSENIMNPNTHKQFKDIVTKLRKSEGVSVCKLDNNKKVISIFNSFEEAAKDVNCSSQLIKNACKQGHEHYKAKGYYWRRKIDIPELRFKLKFSK